MIRILIICAVIVSGCTLEEEPIVINEPDFLVGEWGRYMVFNKDVPSKGFFDHGFLPAGKRSFYASFQIRESGTWSYLIPGYAWAEGEYSVEGKKIRLTNPGCKGVVGTYVYVFRKSFHEMDLQVEEDACSRLGFIAGLWFRNSGSTSGN